MRDSVGWAKARNAPCPRVGGHASLCPPYDFLKIGGRNNSSNLQETMWVIRELGLRYRRIDFGGDFGGNERCTKVSRSRRPAGDATRAPPPPAGLPA